MLELTFVMEYLPDVSCRTQALTLIEGVLGIRSGIGPANPVSPQIEADLPNRNEAHNRHTGCLGDQVL